MTTLKRCPCGQVPTELGSAEGTTCKWAFVHGMCCSEWHIEFRTGYDSPGSAEFMARAVEAWNAAPRGEEKP